MEENVTEPQKYDIELLIKELKEVVENKDESESNRDEQIIQKLDILADAAKACKEDEVPITLDNVFLTLLTHDSNVILAKTAKTIAEIAQTDLGREKCTQSNLTTKLMDLLKGDDVNILIQTSRALGNICYQNEDGNKMVQEHNGLKYILKVLSRGVNLGHAEGAEFLRIVAAGFLLNYLVDQEALQNEAIEQGVVSLLCDVLELDGHEASQSAMHTLLTLEILNESGIHFLDERLTRVLVNMLGNDTASELAAICLEVLHGQAENESSKMLLAKSGICQLLLRLLEKHVTECVNEETRTVLKVACNLIVLIITGDESMKYLYGKGKGAVYTKLITWLRSNFDIDLQIAAVLAMGNFARTDAHCQFMIDQGVHQKLFQLLRENSGSDGDIRFQHALLSAIRNLVIPIRNKPIMLAEGLIDVVYPMLNIPTFPVVFKLLGTLRIVIDKQQHAAIALGKKDDLITKTIEWCKTEDHPGVQGEANRLIAWLVIHSKNADVVYSIINHGAIKYLVKMINGSHSLMQNEALLSLVIITSTALGKCEKDLIDANIGEALRKFFEDKVPMIEAPMLENAITLILTIIQSDDVKKHIKQSNLLQVVDGPKMSNKSNSMLENKIKKMINQLMD
ncbi:rap1 GTPase-GDP dissociation stimulator 1-B isoform X2 [Chelonus insularis]|uniref:rap1 GTPase-GDP dissociation stimulator 1-B isoform X2 n=1 Tax=Chelonus insularis TaxID=460826 RepID=UPI00158A5F3F|nr:rap1 GTPase-GDP dissociation stimulator 1-B isoform X2 [Chelonus insularis]